ncbi:hypothetical protein MIND_00925800 [Mycena indigotica]|uniref:Uncharacterized protein n=1 Tax=Mycena indigotica TaxID=2126181 RepID=A0A8H6SDU9_9AGAR|nr:uncharacterized protein MIND_00925800 [Mycena indigotica]KAF7296940.1 hypothetical protein MIND_00925800 [Mycena indigotica]
MIAEAHTRLEMAQKQAVDAADRTASTSADVRYLKARLRALEARAQRYEALKDKLRVGSAEEKKRARTQLKKGRTFKQEIRAMVRMLLSCGCKQDRIGQVVREVAAAFGIQLDWVLSRRTVGRIALEGLVMARMQIGFELKQTQAFTMSSDSTGRRHQNYQSHHIHLKVPVGYDANSQVVFAESPTTRFVGVHLTTDHSTTTSHATWIRVYDDVMTTFNKSPLAKRTGTLDLRGICGRLRGMWGDHANNEKALSDSMRQTKYDLLLTELGEERMKMIEDDMGELEGRMQEWSAKKIADAGGIEKWNALPAAERAARDLATTAAMVQGLGVEELASMDEGERNLLTVWVWTGCCMHKDQNSFKGGNAAMTAHWKAIGAVGPIPLANKDNAAAVRKVLQPEKGDAPVTDEDIKKLEDIAFGGAKLMALAGAIFHNALDKRGQGDAHELFLEFALNEECVRRFPQTNNTRFGSHGEAAVELITHLDVYRCFMEVIRIRKVNQTYTNIEKNVNAGLHDNPTLTELAVLAIYHILITAPYM